MALVQFSKSLTCTYFTLHLLPFGNLAKLNENPEMNSHLSETALEHLGLPF